MMLRVLQWAVGISSFTLIVVVGVLGLLYQTPEALLLFFADREGNFEIYQMRIDGSRVQNLTRQSEVDWGVTVSPDGQWMVFVSEHNGNVDLYLTGVNGFHNKQNLTQNVSPRAFDPLWSPDGSWIAFTTYKNGSYDIYRMRPNGSDLQNLIEGFDQSVDELSWSPDGQWIAFTSCTTSDDECDIYRMYSDGSNLQNLTPETFTRNLHPTWSPDGQWIVFVSNREGFYDSIYRIRLDGSEIQRLTPYSETFIDHLIQSPDGNWLAFTSYYETGVSNIYRMRPDGSELQLIIQESKSFEHPIWSPDGKWIVFVLSTIYMRQNYEIYRIRVDGTGLLNISNNPAYEEPLGWLPSTDSDWHEEKLLLGAGVALLGIGVLQVAKRRI